MGSEYLNIENKMRKWMWSEYLNIKNKMRKWGMISLYLFMKNENCILNIYEIPSELSS